MDNNIGVVLVTYNRLDCLKKALNCYEIQTVRPSYLLVIDNHSTDGTAEFLDKWLNVTDDIHKRVIHLETNTGGSGGFYTGLTNAMELSAEWIWVADDDAFPEMNAFENILHFYEIYQKKDEIAALCGAVINNGSYDLQHRRRMIKNKLKLYSMPADYDEYNKNAFEINVFSYVGTMIKRNILEKAGLPEKNYFIYFDDSEHSLRVNRVGKIICVPSAEIIHDTGVNSVGEYSWKTYYRYRNELLMIKKHYNQLYFFSTLIRRYLKAVKEAKDKPKELQVLIKSSFMDGFHGIKGMHPKYKPGWKY